MVIIMTFMKLIEETLKKANAPLTAEEIWEKANDYGFVNELKSNKGKTPEKTISARIYVDIKMEIILSIKKVKDLQSSF